MLCPNCGADLADGAKFCPQCGIKLIDADKKNTHESPDPDKADQEAQQAQGAADGADEKPIHKHRGMIIAIIVVAVVIIGLVIVIIVGINSGTATIDLNKYLTITTEGYDGSGTVSYWFDDIGFMNDYYGKISYKTENGSDSSENVAQSLLYDLLGSGSFSKDSYLSNGDEIQFIWTFNPQIIEDTYNVTLKYSDIDYTVDSLWPLDAVDAFNYVTLDFSGISGDGTAEFSYPANMTRGQEELVSSYYRIFPDGYLSNGDTVTVTISDEGLEVMADEYGQKPIELSKEYTVDGLYTFLGLRDDLLQRVQDAAVEKFYDNDIFHDASEETHFENALPKYYLGVYDENGNQLLDDSSINQREFYDWYLDNKWLAETELQSFDYIGYCAMAATSYGESSYHIYLIYDVCFSQYGSTDESDPASPGGRSEFHYYWCPYASTKIEFNDDDMTCTMIPWLEGMTSVSEYGNELENVTYYIKDARTGETAEHKFNCVGIPYDTHIKDYFEDLSYTKGWTVLESTVQ